MGYLQLKDYYRVIQPTNFTEIGGSDAVIRVEHERVALEDIASQLRQKYNVAEEFTDTEVWSFIKTYKASNRVYLDATAYSITSAYAVGALALQGTDVYKCKTVINLPGEAFNAAHWDLIGAQYDMFFVTYPSTPFDETRFYEIGDKVFWKDKEYTALVSSRTYHHFDRLQYFEKSNVPPINIFPDDPKEGLTAWGTGVAYSVAAGTLPTNTTKWTAGDNRNGKLVQIMTDIVLYYIHKRIAPRNIPQTRIEAYMGNPSDYAIKDGKTTYPTYSALGYLQACATGEIMPQLAVIQPSRGKRIRYGGQVKKLNSY
ncbi:hypothetical protein UFOVP1596_43 [uncultured Caudovirales phage]|uniref:Uncharacterized protein n=1 Tax=uncultured Caudovirales phage TaxID=2100421 RepID=A0A6J5SUR1_9CAUD|nr:hypothetical protein UFOVP1596_43 [uncultured Caudovirales phage]